MEDYFKIHKEDGKVCVEIFLDSKLSYEFFDTEDEKFKDLIQSLEGIGLEDLTEEDIEI